MVVFPSVGAEAWDESGRRRVELDEDEDVGAGDVEVEGKAEDGVRAWGGGEAEFFLDFLFELGAHERVGVVRAGPLWGVDPATGRKLPEACVDAHCCGAQAHERARAALIVGCGEHAGDGEVVCAGGAGEEVHVGVTPRAEGGGSGIVVGVGEDAAVEQAGLVPAHRIPRGEALGGWVGGWGGVDLDREVGERADEGLEAPAG